MGAVSTPTLITVAPTGAETAKADAPPLPVTLDELVATAKACEAAGAGLIHIHIRDEAARPSLDLARLTDAVAAVREGTDLVVQLSTGGAVTDPYDARIRVLEALPDSCSLTCGTVNFGSDVFLNPWDFMVELYRRTQELEIVPEFELFDLGHVAALNRLLDKEGLPYGGHVHADLVLGVPGGAPGTTESVVTMARMLPAGASWSATGVGRATLPVALAALSAGGHLRVGMEDTLTFAPGRPVRDNAELVERAASLATTALRPPMTTDEARALLNVKDRRNGDGA
jgi:3-keto-5-aminohexanoate cleavage enzyme